MAETKARKKTAKPRASKKRAKPYRSMTRTKGGTRIKEEFE